LLLLLEESSLNACLVSLIALLLLTAQKLFVDALFNGKPQDVGVVRSMLLADYAESASSWIIDSPVYFEKPLDQALGISQSTEGLCLSRLTSNHANALLSQIQSIETRLWVQMRIGNVVEAMMIPQLRGVLRLVMQAFKLLD